MQKILVWHWCGFFQVELTKLMEELAEARGLPTRFLRAFFADAHRGGGFKYFLFSPGSLRKMMQFDEHIFQMG